MNLVGARHGHFDDNGSRFQIVGANNYYAAFATHSMRGAVIDAAKQMGLNVLRCPAFLDAAWRGAFFQSWNPATNRPEVNTCENGLQRLDHLIADAEQAGIRLILPLVNHWPDFGGMDCYLEWFHAASRDDFYRHPGIRGAYRSYVEQVLTRSNTVTGRSYRDEPSILAWELANEPRCDAADSAAILLKWVGEMSGWIKQNDPNHLRAPVFLPDGRHFFYASSSGGDSAKEGVFVAELDHPKPRRVLSDMSGVVYVPPESGSGLAHLLFLRETTLMAQPLDPDTLQPAGDPFAVAEQASTTNTPPQLAVAASADGTLIYLANQRLDSQLTWYDRSGKVQGKVGARGMVTAVSLSSDGKTAVASRSRAAGPPEMWLYDLARNVESRLTDAESAMAVWSPDGAHVVFYNSRQRSMYLKEVTSGREELLVRGFPSDWSPDGRSLLYSDADSKNQSDIWILPDPLNKSSVRKPVPFLQTPFDESEAQFSPDGHWVAYTSNESGRYEIYLRPFPTPASESGVKWRVSSNGGHQPRWRRDGRELFYLEPALPRLQLMAIPVSPGPRPIAPDATPKTLFEYRARFYVPQLNTFTYSPSNDGQRFLVSAYADQDVRPTLNVMVNWPALVKK